MHKNASKRKQPEAKSVEERRRSHCEAQRRYRKSIKGWYKQWQWRRSPMGKRSTYKYESSIKGQSRKRAYECSDNGIATRYAYAHSEANRERRYQRYHSPEGAQKRLDAHYKRADAMFRELKGRTDRYARMILMPQFHRLLDFLHAKEYGLPPSEKTIRDRARRQRRQEEWDAAIDASIRREQDRRRRSGG